MLSCVETSWRKYYLVQKRLFTVARPKKPTIKDVAQRAQVSVQTVSAVINHKPEITDRTRARVLEAISELGYRPYKVARSLRTRQTHTLALIVPDIVNPSFAALASAAEDCAHAHSYSLMVYNTHDDVERESSYIQGAVQSWVDGVLFVASGDRMPALDMLQSAGIPSVALDRIPAGYNGPVVKLDHRAVGRLAAAHLVALGHTRIAHISGPRTLQVGRERFEGFYQGMRAAGLEPDERWIEEGDWGCEEGYRAMKRMLRRRPYPTALFAASDRMAIGAMRAAHEAGLVVPDDLSVIGVDNIEVSAFITPPLTTIVQPYARMGTLAVQMLLDLLEDRLPDPMRTFIQPELVERQSSGPASRR